MSNDHAGKKFGIAFNNKRKSLGLPILDSSWQLVKNNDEVLLWLPAIVKDSLSYVSKLIKIDEDKILSEENKFFGKEKFLTVDGTFREVLYISCSFSEDEKILNWNCEYRGPNEVFGKSISKNEADSILHEWKLFFDAKLN